MCFKNVYNIKKQIILKKKKHYMLNIYIYIYMVYNIIQTIFNIP